MKYTLSDSQIVLSSLTFFAYHGVLPEERQQGNTFVVDLVLDTDINLAMCTDELSDTINYATVYEVVRQEMSVPSQLLEHVCGRIATSLLTSFAALHRVHVCVTKKNPPIEGAGICESAVRVVMTRG